MGHRLFRFMAASARQIVSESAQRAATGRKVLKTLIATTQQTLMFLGATTFVVVVIFMLKPGFASQILIKSPFAQQHTAPQRVHISQLENWVETAASTATPSEDGQKWISANQQQKQWVSSWISKRYRVASEATDMLVSAAYMTATEIKLDPLLILAVMAIESRFNPFAESPMGAQGLMQVMSKIHHDKFQNLGGVEAALDPVANIKVGSMILKEYVMRGGSVEQGLKSYVGAGAMENDSGYGAKVLAEYRKLKDVASGKKVPISATASASAAKKRSAPTMNAKETEEQYTEAEDIPHEAKNDKDVKKVSVQL